MKDDESIIALLEKQNEAFASFKDRIDSKMGQAATDIDRLFEALKDQAKKAGRPPLFGGQADGAKADIHFETKDGRKLPAYRKSQLLADNLANVTDEEKNFSIARYVREAMEGKAVTSGPAVVPTFVSANVIDDVRALTTVVQAGSLTVPIDGPTNLARITGDPTVFQHAEGATDITESDATFTPVLLNPKTLAALVPLSMEVVADSPNLDIVLRTSIANAFASKLDALCLATLLADANIPKSTVAEDPALWLKVLAAVGSAMGVKQPLPTAMITNNADFIARASQQASTAGSWLGKPPVLANMAELYTTALAAGTAFLGGFEAGFAIALREQLVMEVIRYGKPTSATHLLIATMRADGVVVQPKRLYKQLKTVA